jgi:hypothetical protein
MTFTLEELREYFGEREWLIGRVKKRGKGFAYLRAIRDTGEPWKYPDGTEVDDILWVSKDDVEYKEGDWVLIRGYEVNDGSDPAHKDCRLRAQEVQLLQEVGDLKEIIPDEPPLPVRKLLSHAIYDVRVVGPRILALQSFLAEERRRIEEKATQELSRREQEIRDKEIALEQRERELEQREESLDQRERELEKREEDVLREYEEVEKLRSLLLQPAPRKTRRPDPVPAYEFASESDLITHVRDFIRGQGFHYGEWVLENFFTCLKTDWLVILAGISGTGKSKLPELFAESIGGEFEIIPVRPDWNDDRDLFGFFNLRTRRYQSTRFLEFLLEAQNDPDRLYIVCLDEMNLAPVEYYFAQLLSALESEEPVLTPDEALTEEVMEHLQEHAYIRIGRLDEKRRKADGVRREAIEREIRLWSQWISELERYQKIPVPRNVRFIGTVNVDHTTHGFSDKVIDRVNVIQFESVDFEGFDRLRRSSLSEILPKGLSFHQFSKFCELQPTPELEKRVQEFVSHLTEISKTLEYAGIHVGFRIYRDVERYMGLAIQGGYFPDPTVAFDFQIKQRVLPKIRGMQSSELEESLKKLGEFLSGKRYQESKKKVDSMLHLLRSKGYVNYWEVR